MPESRWSRSPDVAVIDHGDRVVVLDLSRPADARPLVLEGPAAAVWHAIAEPGTAADIVARVAADFDLPATEVRHDVESFLSALADQGLARIEPGPRLDPVRDGADDA